MESITTQNQEAHRPHGPIEHSAHHIEPHSVYDSVKLGIIGSTLCFIPGGLAIGYSRIPGSIFAYGLSGLIWPLVICIGLGVSIGGSLGYVFGVIAHASDPVPPTARISQLSETMTSDPLPSGLKATMHRN